jgi:predicted nucleotidyltransferase
MTMAESGSFVDADTRRAALEFMARVAARYPVEGAVLFGSRARGSHRADSDADVAVLLHGERGPFVATKLGLADIAYDLLLETGIRIEPLPIWEDEWRDPDSHSNPELVRNIRRDGVSL